VWQMSNMDFPYPHKENQVEEPKYYTHTIHKELHNVQPIFIKKFKNLILQFE